MRADGFPLTHDTESGIVLVVKHIAAILAFAAVPAFAAGDAGHRFTATVNYTGAPAADVPAALRLSADLVDGFDYAAAGDGTHFTITDGTGAVLPYEIDTWNPGGESLLWVKIPYFANGRKLAVTYGDTERNMAALIYTSFHDGIFGCGDFIREILAVVIIDNVFQNNVHTAGSSFVVITVITVIHRYEADSQEREDPFQIVAQFNVITTKAAEVFYGNKIDLAFLNLLHHFLK